jgi:hypothetical protein
MAGAVNVLDSFVGNEEEEPELGGARFELWRVRAEELDADRTDGSKSTLNHRMDSGKSPTVSDWIWNE